LGLSPRAHAFTSSRARPKFVTPFKKPSDRKVQVTHSTPTNQPLFEYKGKGREGLSSVTEASKKTRGPGLEYSECILRQISPRKLDWLRFSDTFEPHSFSQLQTSTPPCLWTRGAYGDGAVSILL
jgi:hypothetical protein